jgi:hypothetical protein
MIALHHPVTSLVALFIERGDLDDSDSIMEWVAKTGTSTLEVEWKTRKERNAPIADIRELCLWRYPRILT